MAGILEQRDASALPPGTAACLGAFDGLHLGHQALLRRAAELGERVALVTFDPHPLEVVAPHRAPPLIHSPAVRRRVAAHLGVAHLVLLPFDAAMAAMSPDEFVERVLVHGLRPAAIVVGEDFRFGHGRAGTATGLAERLQPLGIEVAIVQSVSDDGGHSKLGATEIREAILRGDVGAAGHMLGRWHSISGTVVRGDARGRTLGFPTANVQPDGGLLPPDGIYATVLTVWSPDAPDHGAAWPSATSLGTNPTFASDAPGAAPRRLEVHVIDRDLGERLYGVEVEVAFVEHLRDEHRFDGVSELVEQIARDVDQARARLDPATVALAVMPDASAEPPSEGGSEVGSR